MLFVAETKRGEVLLKKCGRYVLVSCTKCFNYAHTMHFTPFFRSLSAAILLLSSAVGTHGQVAHSLADSLPDAWTQADSYQQTFPSDDHWWKSFGDALLDSLIAEGEQANFNLRQATRRIEMARQTLRSARSGYYPTLGVSAGWNKTRSSGVTTANEAPATTVDFFSATADMNWEIDLFGKVRERSRQAGAQLNASRADYAAMSVSICSEIASTYIQLRTLQQQLAVTEAHVSEQEKVLKIAEARFEAMIASMLDVSQARTVYYSTKASLTSLRTSIACAINSLAVLTGNFPEAMAARLSRPAPQPDFAGSIAAGVPVDLLRRRPDVAEAEFAVASYAAALGIAKKDYLPTLSLKGEVGTQAHRIGKLMTGPSFTYTIAPTLSWTIFDGFARNAAVASAKAQMMEGIDAYNQTLLTAVQEVENAMVTYTNALLYENEINEVVVNARKAFDLSLDRYKQGLDPFINVADSQITLLQYANELVAARGNTLSAAVAIYKALGGGWENTAL